MTAENTEMLTFVSLKLCFLSFVHRHNKLLLSYLWSFICKFTSADKIRIRAHEGTTPTHCFIYSTFMAGVYAEVYAFKVTSLYSAFIFDCDIMYIYMCTRC